MSPVIPHFSQYMWDHHYKKVLSEEEKKSVSEFVSNTSFPHYEPKEINLMILKKNEYMNKVGSNLRSTYEKFQKKNKKKKEVKKVYIICTDEYKPWEAEVLKKLSECKKENL